MTDEFIAYYMAEELPHLERMRNYYENLTNWGEIQEYAALGYAPNPHGRRVINGHQCRLVRGSRPEAAEKMELDENKLNSFTDIFDATEDIRRSTDGVGDLWSYDAALRVSFKLNKLPEMVYLQSGAKLGAEDWLGRTVRERALHMQVFANAIPELTLLSELEPYQLENLLCIGRHHRWQVPEQSDRGTRVC